jgi:hypothetical protein
MKPQFIIIAILITLKVIGIASHARADSSYKDYFDSPAFKEQLEKKNREREKQWKYINSHEAKKQRKERQLLEDAKTITNIDDYSYTAEYLNGKKEYCIRNNFKTLDCVDYSLISFSIINHKSNKITNGKISKDEESEMKEKEETILSMTLSSLFNIT